MKIEKCTHLEKADILTRMLADELPFGSSVEEIYNEDEDGEIIETYLLVGRRVLLMSGGYRKGGLKKFLKDKRVGGE